MRCCAAFINPEDLDKLWMEAPKSKPAKQQQPVALSKQDSLEKGNSPEGFVDHAGDSIDDAAAAGQGLACSCSPPVTLLVPPGPLASPLSPTCHPISHRSPPSPAYLLTTAPCVSPSSPSFLLTTTPFVVPYMPPYLPSCSSPLACTPTRPLYYPPAHCP